MQLAVRWAEEPLRGDKEAALLRESRFLKKGRLGGWVLASAAAEEGEEAEAAKEGGGGFGDEDVGAWSG